jgi:rod shape determining protein RodA
MFDRRVLRQIDWTLLGAAAALGTIGVLMVFSATSVPGKIDYAFAIRQTIWLGIGVMAAITVASVPLRVYDALAPYVYGLSLVCLAAVLVVGQEVYGAKRWLGAGQLRFQPSELGKLATLLLLARVLDDKRVNMSRMRSWLKPAIVALVPMLLVLKEPDLGTSLTFGVLLAAMLYWAGLPFRTLALFAVPMLNAGLFLITRGVWASAIAVLASLALIRPRMQATVLALVLNGLILAAMPVLWSHLEPYQQGRIETFLNPGNDPYGAGYQIIQSRIAIGSGGPFGRGYLHGTQKGLEFLPMKHTDFIFSVVGEELGFWGVTIVIALYTILLSRGLWLARVARNRFASLVALGVTAAIWYHVMVNILMTVGWAPVTGLPLPLVSYGGTSFVVTCVEIGLLLNVSLRRQEY